MSASRRDFLRGSALAGGGLTLGLTLPMGEARAAQPFIPNAWLRIHADERVVFLLSQCEMGQGVMTSNTMLIAEELEVDPARIEIEFAPAGKAYVNTALEPAPLQATGASTSTRAGWTMLREAGAVARELLVAAALARWGVDRDSVTVEDGIVRHGDETLSYGALAADAATMRVRKPALKPASEFKVIGTSLRRFDARAKTDGTAIYGMDVKRPELLTAVILRSPFLGGKLIGFDATEAEQRPGVHTIVEVAAGVAVVAKGYWHARTAAALVEVEWDESQRNEVTTRSRRQDYAALCDQESLTIRSEGDVDSVEGTAVSAVYELPFVHHATMEPMNCTAHVQDERCDVWAPTQSVGISQEAAARVCGLKRDQVFVHTTLLGGGFGRRSMPDFVAEAVEVAAAVGGPVKVVWSREDDMQNGFLRPATYNRIEGVVVDGTIRSWQHRLVSQSVLASVAAGSLGALTPGWMPYGAKDRLARFAEKRWQSGKVHDPVALEGADHIPYSIDNILFEYQPADPGVPVGFWRGVGNSSGAFVVESFVDELAHAAGRDRFEIRREMLQHPDSARNLRVLELVAEKAEWGSELPEGLFRGIAQHACYGSFVAMVAEIRMEGSRVRVERIVCAADCGTMVNPDLVTAQIESAIIYGLSATLKHGITHDRGRVEQTNFHTFDMTRMFDAPHVETHLVVNDEHPAGAGEISLPTVAPAVANAVFAATGIRHRHLPLEPLLVPPDRRGRLGALVEDLDGVKS